MTMPAPDDDRDARPLGSEVSDPAADGDTYGGSGGPASGVAGPSYPPEETEPDTE
jgi:hypothetical protein